VVGFDRAGVAKIAAECCAHTIVRAVGCTLYVAAHDAPAEWLAGVEPRGSA
jgi:hypothetical protein